ncbi:lantibiotic dehydratase [Kitasatospora sp. LaBMicrA B282]|uniref:lantibiotic dehydratase n=1 Tax=Kitasatospora sp. LaBMicrA B282 TaxID=3420949 RepID=UPI003D108DBD
MTTETAGRAGLGRHFMLRVGGLPIEAVHGLRAPDSLAWAEQLLTEEERLAALGARLSDQLAVLVKGAVTPERRRALLGLRRQVFNGRLPSRPAEVLALARGIGGPTGELLTEWLLARQRLDRLAARGPAVLAADLTATRRELHRLAERDELRLGLLLASPTLADRISVQLGDPAATPDKRARKMERSVLSYLYRTACKTSPFSTFTPVAPGRFDTGDDVPDGGELRLGAGRSSHPRLNVVVLARLAELIAADPVRRRDLPLAPASGWELTDDRIRYVQRSVTAADAATPVSFDAARDRLFFLRLSGVLEQLLALFAERPRIRYGELAELLRDQTRGSTADAEHYLHALLDVGMLQLPALAVDVHTTDPIRAFQAALRELDRPWADAVARQLAGPAELIERYPAADATARQELLARLRAELAGLRARLADGLAEPPALPQTLLYEDVAAGAVSAGAADWAELAARPLDELAAILPLFDLGLAQRLTLKGFFLARHGRGGSCPDLLQLVHDFHEDIFNQYLQFTALKPAQGPDGGYPPEENWLGLPELTALDRARAELAERMRQKWRAGGAEVVLEPADLAAVADELAPLSGRFAPHSHFVQPAVPVTGEPLLVLNHSYGGLAFPFTRFTHCFAAPDGGVVEGPDGADGADCADGADGADGAPLDDGGLVAELRAALRAAQPPGTVFAEVTAGAATTNLNLHARLTDYEIVCPGETSTAPADARLQLDDLTVAHDPVADRLLLRSKRLGREVVPLYLGYLVPMVLPEIPRSLLLFSPTSRVTPELWRGVPTGPAEDGVTRRPRVRYGRLVLHRRSWTAAPEALPQPRPGQREAERFLDWQRWRRRHRLPAQVFARVLPVAGEQVGGSKPQYLDFASPLSLLALDGLLSGGPVRLLLEEMLPGDHELPVRSAQGRHVAELALEIIPDLPEGGAQP